MKWLIVLFIFLSGVGTYQTSKIKYELPEVKYKSIQQTVIIDEKDSRNSDADRNSHARRMWRRTYRPITLGKDRNDRDSYSP